MPEDTQPSTLDALWEGLKTGGAKWALGTAQFALGRHGAQPTARSPGEAAAMGNLADRTAAVQQNYEQSPSVQQNPVAAGVGQFVGQAAPSMMMGGGRAAMQPLQSAASRIGGGALAGAAGAASMPVTSGDYYDEKLKQILPGAAAGGAIPAAGGMIAPRLPSMASIQGGVARAFRPLYDFMQGAEERTREGFARTIAREALAPINGMVQGRVSGHDLLDNVRDQIGAAYDRVLPSIALHSGEVSGGASGVVPEFAAFLSTMGSDDKRFIATLSTDHLNVVNRLWDNYVRDRFSGGSIDGKTFKRIQSELGGRAFSWLGTNQDEAGKAAYRILNHLNEQMANANPMFAPQLRNANSAYRAYALMRDAAGKPTAEGTFGPGDMLRAINKASTDEQWAGGKNVLQMYSNAAQRGMASGRSGVDWAHLLSRHGLPLEVARGLSGPVGRTVKSTAPITAPVAGEKAKDTYTSVIGP